MTNQPAVEAAHVLAANRYMVLSTSPASGRPWASPVYFVNSGLRRFLWVSRPESAHSRNLRDRAEVAIVVFNSQVEIGQGRAFYATAIAKPVPDDDLVDDLSVFSEGSVADGAGTWGRARVTGEAPLRLFRADVTAAWVFATDDGPDRRIPVTLD